MKYISNNSGNGGINLRNDFRPGPHIDSSMEMDQYSMTDSSSYISGESSFSLDSKDRSCSNDLRKSFDS